MTIWPSCQYNVIMMHILFRPNIAKYTSKVFQKFAEISTVTNHYWRRYT